MPGEFDLIDWIRSNQGKSPLVSVGIGDDLAELKWPADDLLLVGVDQVIDGVHFDSSVHSPRQIGRKAMNRNLSDCAAMGCLPAAAVVAVALPKGRPIDNAKELYHGLREAGDVFACVIVGGDTATWDGKLVVSVTILGRSAGVRPVTRGGALPGHGIYVTGPLGGSILGRHLTFQPRIALGRQLAAIATAMIDLSDGLSRDLSHICRASGVGAVIESRHVPIHLDAVELSRRDGISAMQHALNDGEDYELLFTCAAEISSAIRIGRTTETPGIFLEDENANRTPLVSLGWEHNLGIP
ncbi:MAG TPA: thiamine-phosphate kinase [Tepidisphaeraceae bacterium]|jgi:thiamine-monophosphate kinase|nr:thiamine-phosphate kinase [Tepidisphaeraceae bacterium]